jgi:hypothetical protein
MESKPIIIYSIKKYYTVIYDGMSLETYDKSKHDILSIAKVYKDIYEPRLTVDIDTDIYETTQDAINEYCASYTGLGQPTQTINTTDESAEAIIIKAPGTTGKNTIMNKIKSIKATARLQALTGASVSTVASVLHFGMQTATDVIPRIEGVILSKVLRFDKTVDEIIARREAKTASLQASIINGPKGIIEKFNTFKAERDAKRPIVVPAS